MAKIAIFVGSFLLGVAATSIVTYFLWQEFHPSTTEIWTASTDLKLANGTTIPDGTEFIVDAYMPEGFVSLALFVNVEGESLSRFTKRTENARVLKIPYWVEQ